jgi:biopolymer transport protein ExbB
MMPLLAEGDAISRLVAWVLLLMSIASWVVIGWKGLMLLRLGRSLSRCIAAFWQAPGWAQAEQRVQALDTQGVLMPMLQAVQQRPVATLAAAGDERAQLTRLLRDGLQQLSHRLQYGQILLATVGATAPFVGLLGTVWGIYLALTGMAASGQMAIDQVTGPIGEALIMTAAGLAVALPAVLAYNVMGRRIGQLEAELEGFAHDLRELLIAPKAGA